MKSARALVATAFALALGSSYLAYGALGGPTGVRIPYSGTLERDGAPVSGEVDITLGVFNVAVDGSACSSSTLPTMVTAGKFAVVLGPVPEGCVKNKDVWLELAVDDGSGPITLGGRQRVYPALAANTAGSGDFDVGGTLTAASATIGTLTATAASATTANIGALNVSGTTSLSGDLGVGFSYGNWDNGYFSYCPAGTRLFAPDVIGPKVTCPGAVGSVSHNGTRWYADCAPAAGIPLGIKSICTRISMP